MNKIQEIREGMQKAGTQLVDAYKATQNSITKLDKNNDKIESLLSQFVTE